MALNASTVAYFAANQDRRSSGSGSLAGSYAHRSATEQIEEQEAAEKGSQPRPGNYPVRLTTDPGTAHIPENLTHGIVVDPEHKVRMQKRADAGGANLSESAFACCAGVLIVSLCLFGCFASFRNVSASRTRSICALTPSSVSSFRTSSCTYWRRGPRTSSRARWSFSFVKEGSAAHKQQHNSSNKNNRRERSERETPHG
jgi:hypothetical protein